MSFFDEKGELTHFLRGFEGIIEVHDVFIEQMIQL